MKPLRLLLLMVALSSLGACATSRSVVTPGMELSENPADGAPVRIERVEDRRSFETSPRSPDIPSLSGQDYSNASFTARAIARKRNSYGMAMGDVLLPEGETVADLVAKAVAQGFRQAGYRVVAPGDPGYEQAATVNATINEFWSWFTPGFATVSLSNRSSVDLTGSVPALQGRKVVTAEVSESMMAVFEDDWTKIVSKGLDKLALKIAEKLRGH